MRKTLDTQALEGAIERARRQEVNFPQFVSLIEAAGVEGYVVDVRRRVLDYRGHGGSHAERSHAADAPTPVAEAFDPDGLKEALARAQRRESEYPIFLMEIGGAGVRFYTVHVAARLVVYEGGGRCHVEQIPRAA